MQTSIDMKSFEPRSVHSLLLFLIDNLKKGESFEASMEEDPNLLFKKVDSHFLSDIKWQAHEAKSGQWSMRVTKNQSFESEKSGCCGACGG